jgi:hypothetical protein
MQLEAAITKKRYFLLILTVVLNFVFICLKLLALAFLFEILESPPVYTASSLKVVSCPPTRCTSTARTVCKDIDIFRKQLVTLYVTVF